MKTPFDTLWSSFHNMLEKSGQSRLASVLKNHADKKEYICRKLGVVKEADLSRISSSLHSKRNK